MKIIIKKERLLYDISNLAYVVTDAADPEHKLHIVADICMEGNIDRVARLLGLAHARLNQALRKILILPKLTRIADISAETHDYVFRLAKDSCGRNILSDSAVILLKETIHEYFVCFVLADWLGFILPVQATVWRQKAEKLMEAIGRFPELSSLSILRRHIPPL